MAINFPTGILFDVTRLAVDENLRRQVRKWVEHQADLAELGFDNPVFVPKKGKVVDLNKRIDELLATYSSGSVEELQMRAFAHQLAKEVAQDCAQIARRKGEHNMMRSARLAAISIEDKYDL